MCAKREKKGEITVYLALSMTVLLAFVLAVIEAARVETIRFQIECAADMSLYSTLAEYQRTLQRRFHLFFVDTTYGKEVTGLSETERHLCAYLDENLDVQDGLPVIGAKDFLALHAVSADITGVSLATDKDCLVLKSQAVSYMRHRTGLTTAEEILGNLREIDSRHLEEGIEQQREKNRAEIKKQDGRRVKVDDEWKTIHIDDPAGHIPVRDSGVAYLVTGDSGGVSGASIHAADYVSARDCDQGGGLAPEREAADGTADEALFGEYLLEHLSRYTAQKADTQLRYEVEYVLGGKDRDAENLKYVINRILLIREVVNYLYLRQDSLKQMQARAAAAVVSAVALMPELEELLTEGILLAWAYTESVNDVKILLEQGRVPLQKSSQDWQMGFMDMLHYQTALTGGSGGTGMSYEDYLRVFLLMENREDKALRLGDVIEMDMRRTPGNRQFRLDRCLESLEAELTAESAYGYTYLVRKRYGYEMLE